MIQVIGFDADDTLWHNEPLYYRARDRCIQLFSGHHDPALIERRLSETEIRNIQFYGYGIKSFILSMIESAVELTYGETNGQEIQEIIAIAKQMLSAEVELFEHVEETLAELSTNHELMLITKGDLFEQERKIRRSGLVRYFDYIEVVSEKSEESYKRLLAKYKINPKGFLMVGNSFRSDILPVIKIGGRAVYIHYKHTWAHEMSFEWDIGSVKYDQLEHIGQLPEFIASL